MLDMNEDVDVNIILGLPFLTTSRALLDIQDGKMIVWAGDEEVIFNLLEPMKPPTNEKQANKVKYEI